MISVKQQGPDASDPAARLVAVASRAASICRSASSNDYAVMVERAGQQEPATDIRWPADFENQYVKWQAPVLTAKAAGGTQWIRADVGGRTVLLRHDDLPARRTGRHRQSRVPTEVVILSDQRPGGPFPRGGPCSMISAWRPAMPTAITRLVTKKASCRLPSRRRRTVQRQQRPVDRRHPGRPRWRRSSTAYTRRNRLDADGHGRHRRRRNPRRATPITMLPGETVPLKRRRLQEAASR